LNAVAAVAGAQNLFDEYPSANPEGEVAGLIDPEQSPSGFYYVRGTWRPAL